MEFTTGKFVDGDQDLILSLTARKLDRTTYSSGLDQFADDHETRLSRDIQDAACIDESRVQ